jgi:hypothetical protein
MKYVFLIGLIFSGLNNNKLRQKLSEQLAENDNLRYQLSQCRILYKNN